MTTFLFGLSNRTMGMGEKPARPKPIPVTSRQIIIGIARHDENMKDYLKAEIELPERKDYYGKKIEIRTFFTTIFEPWEKTEKFIKKIKSYDQLPSITLEFRSWAQMLNDPIKVRAEKQRIDSQFGPAYYDRLMSHIKNETVLDGVIKGDFDLILNFHANNLAPLGALNLRIFHEPFWFPWKMHKLEDIEKFVKAVKHAHQILQENGADNVHIVITFDISGFDVEESILQEILPYGIVNVIEIDGYNDAWRRSLWKKDPTVEEMFGPKVKKINAILDALSPGKIQPLFIIGETAFDGTGRLSKRQMYQDCINFVKENRLDGIVFLDENDGPIFEGDNGWYVDWTLDESWAKEILDQLSTN